MWNTDISCTLYTPVSLWLVLYGFVSCNRLDCFHGGFGLLCLEVFVIPAMPICVKGQGQCTYCNCLKMVKTKTSSLLLQRVCMCNTNQAKQLHVVSTNPMDSVCILLIKVNNSFCFHKPYRLCMRKTDQRFNFMWMTEFSVVAKEWSDCTLKTAGLVINLLDPFIPHNHDIYLLMSGTASHCVAVSELLS